MIRGAIFLATIFISIIAYADEDLTMTIICTNEERVQEIVCPIVVINEQVKACECPEGMEQSFTAGNPPPKASGS